MIPTKTKYHNKQKRLFQCDEKFIYFSHGVNDSDLKTIGEQKMANIKESATAYEPPQTKNIAELKNVDVNLDITVEKFKEGTPDEYTLNCITIKGEKYRVPTTVLKGLKACLEAKPDLKTFRVIKSGEGMNTSYQVVPL